ncbi:MAG: hypothetical protein JEZ08_05340 [Clostridiales bacterium]|nr:hypothetical protein [Clostridiales bacterium]
MKKIVGIIIALSLFLFPVIVFGVEDGEEAVILPNNIEAYDSFNYLNSLRWVITTSDWEMRDNQYGTYLRNNEGGSKGFAYQPFDYNSGELKSDYYRFKVRVDGYDNSTWSAFGIHDSLIFDYYITPKMSVVKSYTKYLNKADMLTFDYDLSAGEERFKVKTNDTYLNYEFILRRVGVTNRFDTVLNVYDDHNMLLFTDSEDYVLLNNIYPVFWVEENKKGYLHEFEAYHIPEDIDAVVFDQLQQDGDKINVDWHSVGDAPESVKLFFSEDETIDFNNDILVTVNANEFNISDEMKGNGYFAVVGFENGKYGEPTIVPFNYLNPVSNFTYVPTSTPGRYKFTWDAVDGAQKYIFGYGVDIPIDADQLTATVDVYNPNSVTLYAKKPSSVHPDESYSKVVTAQKGKLKAVENFDATIVGDRVELSWSQYPDITSYKLYKKNGNDDFLSLDDIITTTTYDDPLDVNFLRLSYNITAIVGGEESVMTTTVSLGNRVKNIKSEFNDPTSRVEVTWDGIGQANKYRVYMSENADMTDATYVDVDTNAYAFAFNKNDKVNKYIQVEAMYLDEEIPSKNIYADKSDVLTIDFSRNNAVTGIVTTYEANTYEVDLSWNQLAGATAYNVLVGDSPTTLSYVETVVDENYTYRIKNADKNKLYFSVQGVSASQNFVQSTPVNTSTFEKDMVENLSVNYNGSTKKAEVRWSSLLRAEKYILTVGSNSYEVDGNTKVLDNIAVGTNFTVKGVKMEDAQAVYSQPSNIVTAFDVEYDIKVEAGPSFSNKPYGQPIELELEVTVNKLGIDLNTVSLEFDLKNIFEPGTSDIIASYIYPEIMDVKVNGLDNVDYLTTVKSGQIVNGEMNADGGYTVKIIFSDAVDNQIASGSKIVIKLKTDMRFSNLTGDVNSILYVNSNQAYAQMELPFHIEEQIVRLENQLGYGPFIQDETRIDVVLSYKTSTDAGATTYTKYQLINYDFKNKELIIGE